MAFQWLHYIVAQFATLVTEKEKFKSNQFRKSRENELVLFMSLEVLSIYHDCKMYDPALKEQLMEILSQSEL